MRTALFLIALGFGYKIYLEALQQKSKQLQQLGQFIGAVMMLVSIAGAIFLVSLGIKRTCYMKGSCSLFAKPVQTYEVGTTAPSVSKR